MTITEVSLRYDMTADTLRYYEKVKFVYLLVVIQSAWALSN